MGAGVADRPDDRIALWRFASGFAGWTNKARPRSEPPNPILTFAPSKSYPSSAPSIRTTHLLRLLRIIPTPAIVAFWRTHKRAFTVGDVGKEGT
jgi:hypothetical protein